ncbi:hypothetical protein [Phormidesmis priestleyi]
MVVDDAIAVQNCSSNWSDRRSSFRLNGLHSDRDRLSVLVYGADSF